MSTTLMQFTRRLAVTTLLVTPLSFAQSLNAHRSMMNGVVDETHRVALAGNVRAAALNPANDQGALDGSQPLNHMLLQLKRSPESEAALEAFLATVNDATAPNFHKWLTAEQLGTEYGPAPADIEAVTAWLTSHGLTVNRVYPSGMVIDFSGNVDQVESAFRAGMHRLSVNGEKHIANTADPQIPGALAGVITGVVSLHDFHPRPMHRSIPTGHIDVHTGTLSTQVPPATKANAVPGYTYSSGTSTYQAVVPGDLATIYNLAPLFKYGLSGQGQTIVVVEDTNVYDPADWDTFRSTFGLSQYTAGSFVQVHPGPNCANPGVNGDEGEAILDAEWASAAAPSAQIMLASCANTTTFGGLIALENLISQPNPPKLVSVSYGESESQNGAAANASYNAAYQAAAAAGISVFVSSGDEGAASSDANQPYVAHGITVSGLASTPYNVAVGGTDFGDTYAGSNATYWNTTNSSTYASAKSYIPEIPWNDSCASLLLAQASGYNVTQTGGIGFCNSANGEAFFLTTASGSGGPSGCATGVPSVSGVVSGTCKGYAKPSWQTGFGVVKDGVRDLPDVSLFAANGVWGHYYVFCDSDVADGGALCTGAPSNWSGAGGTSFASPIMAAIQSLVNQAYKSPWGNPNPTYYNLAAVENGTTGNASCNSTNGNAAGSNCVFYDVTKGDIDLVCKGTLNCYIPAGNTYGILYALIGSSYGLAYGTTPGWDFATGLGSVNVINLIKSWGTVGH